MKIFFKYNFNCLDYLVPPMVVVYEHFPNYQCPKSIIILN